MNDPRDYRPGAVTWAGLTTVLASAAVLSFASLRDLAVSCRISPTLAALLPITVDAGAAVATRAWLSRRANPDAERFARRMTWGLLSLTVVGNAAHQGMAANGVTPPWWVAVIVGAVAPAVVGACVHLAVLLGRPADVAGTDASSTPSAPAAPSAVIVHPRLPDVTEPAEAVNPGRVVGGNVGGSVQDRPVTPGPDPAVLIAAGAGRRKLAAELGVTEHEARQLIERHRANGHAVLEDAR